MGLTRPLRTLPPLAVAAIGLAVLAPCAGSAAIAETPAPASVCWHFRDLKYKPPVIPRYDRDDVVPEKVLDPERLRKVVQVYDPADPRQSQVLSHLEDATYVYLKDNRGRVAMMNRAVRMPNGQFPVLPAIPFDGSEPTFVGSHDGLMTYLKWLDERHPPPPGTPPLEVVGAGEVRIRYGRPAYVSNGSGSYRGNFLNLHDSRRSLYQLGLRSDRNTEIRDYGTGKYPNPHSSAPEEVRLELVYGARPKLYKIWKETRDSMSEFSQSGRDIRAVFQVYHRYAYGDAKDPAKATTLREAGTFIDAWNRNQDCEAAIIDRFIQNLHGADKFREMLAVIRQLAAHGDY